MHRRQVRFVCRGRLPKLPSPPLHTRAPVHLLLRCCYVDVARLPRPSPLPPPPPFLRPPLPHVQFFVRHRGFHTSVLHNETFHTRESLYIIIHSIANWIGVSVCRWTPDCFHFLTAFKDDGGLLLALIRIYKFRKSVIVVSTTGDYPLEIIVSAVLSDYSYKPSAI